MSGAENKDDARALLDAAKAHIDGDKSAALSTHPLGEFFDKAASYEKDHMLDLNYPKDEKKLHEESIKIDELRKTVQAGTALFAERLARRDAKQFLDLLANQSPTLKLPIDALRESLPDFAKWRGEDPDKLLGAAETFMRGLYDSEKEHVLQMTAKMSKAYSIPQERNGPSGGELDSQPWRQPVSQNKDQWEL